MSTFGMNLRVTTDSKQGGRKYMEDVLSVKFQKSADGKNIDYTYLAVFDGHGGVEAAQFAKQHLLNEITKQKGFWSDCDAQVTKAIRDGFLSCHQLMWKNLACWPKTVLGHPSTSGTTVSVVFIKNGKLYIAHVGDSNVVLGLQAGEADALQGRCVTDEHKPDAPKELKRIESSGGSVVAKAGVQRVVWNRPKKAHQGPIRRSTPIDRIPFLAIARALGDLWSYNSDKDTFVVSPDPDISVHPLDLAKHKCIILASDGLWNMVKSQEAANIVKQLDEQSRNPYTGVKPASVLVRYALDKWCNRCLRADNTSVIVAFLDPPQPSSSPPGRPSLSTAGSTASSEATTYRLGSDDSLSDLDCSDEDLDLGGADSDTSHLHMGSPRFTHILPAAAHRTAPADSRHTDLTFTDDRPPPAPPLLGKHKSSPAKLLPRVDSTQVLEKLPKYSKQPSSPARLLRSPARRAADDSALPRPATIKGFSFSRTPTKHTDSHNLRTKVSPAGKTEQVKHRHNSGSGLDQNSVSAGVVLSAGVRQVGCNLTNGQPARSRSFSVGSAPRPCAKSPLKIEPVTAPAASAMISPIWPLHLDSDLPTTSSAVLQENSGPGATSRVLKSARSFLRIFRQGGSQNQAPPVTRGGLKRKVTDAPAASGANPAAKKRKLLPKVVKLQNTVLHSARLKRKHHRKPRNS